MAISNERRDEFGQKSAKEMSLWLTTAVPSYFNTRSRYELRPFELFVGTGDSTAGDFSNMYCALTANGKRKFRRAIVLMFEQAALDASTLKLWEFGIELAWILEVHKVRDIVLRRLAVREGSECVLSDPRVLEKHVT